MYRYKFYCECDPNEDFITVEFENPKNARVLESIARAVQSLDLNGTGNPELYVSALPESAQAEFRAFIKKHPTCWFSSEEYPYA